MGSGGEQLTASYIPTLSSSAQPPGTGGNFGGWERYCAQSVQPLYETPIMETIKYQPLNYHWMPLKANVAHFIYLHPPITSTSTQVAAI